MTEAKRKAEELYAKFLAITANDSIDNPISVMKRPVDMALICVGEIIDQLDCRRYDMYMYIKDREFWQEVRNELNKMK